MTTTDTEPVLTEHLGDHVLVTRLNRPSRHNAINIALAEALAAAFEAYAADPLSRCAVLTGEGKTFCAGLDLVEAAKGHLPRIDVFRDPVAKPLIAAVEGNALAGGFELCLKADLIVAANNANMGLPEVRRGLVPIGGGAIKLPRRIPYHAAAEIMLTGRPVPATELHRLGLVNRLTEPGDALAAALEMAADIAGAAPLAVQATKQILEHTGDWTMEEAWKRQMEHARPALKSEDAKEGPRAFAEKREPVWVGR